ncbi:MAG: UDP-N-acetylglucosamine 1-carboxyvinyltransferase [Puniceicoccales bacterium]|jgi:UDP-N-acetylglucosamine 1-carboxyvinyltransferase|nr:UDP-N-acetylglucosamine 1-carboxyvinyltransferase [Puniceicoccales bacterium]
MCNSDPVTTQAELGNASNEPYYGSSSPHADSDSTSHPARYASAQSEGLNFATHVKDHSVQMLRVQGGRPLGGRVRISGSKNAGLPALAASLLTDESVTLHRVPALNDIRFMVRILEDLGCEISFKAGEAHIRAREIDGDPFPECVRQMRASVCLLGPLVARMKRVSMPLPGGCVIGQRPIDLHLRGLKALGCEISIQNGLVSASAGHLKGTTLSMGGPFGSTVTGTVNIICAATLAQGTTVIRDAAREPEVADLCRMLNKMGAKIGGIGESTLTIEGVERLHGVSHELIPDRIEFGTFLLLALASRSKLELPKVDPSLCGALVDVLAANGAEFEETSDFFVVHGNRSNLRPMCLETLPFPGLPTDLQAPLCALLTQIFGESSIKENIYPNRFTHIGELQRMGANISTDGPQAIIRGATQLSGTSVIIPDLRAGACLYLAALIAKGESLIYGVHHVDRGYENFDEKLKQIGAVLQREEVVRENGCKEI